MESSRTQSAVDAALATARELGLKADDAVILQDSNRVVLRLMPCDVVARIAPMALAASATFEIEVARRLAGTGSPAAALDPRVEPRLYVRGGFAINFWTYYQPLPAEGVTPSEYARALGRLHAGLREVDLDSPHFTERVAEAQRLLDNRDDTPELPKADRELLSGTLQTLRSRIEQRGGAEQLLHGEPHPGNVLMTKDGLRFIDFETCCRGPVEFDIAHLPEDVHGHYPGADEELLRACRVLTLAMVATWRWDQNDQFPNGRQMGTELLREIRAALDGYDVDAFQGS